MVEILRAVNIKKNFGNTLVLKGIDLTVNKGEFISIMGPSGSGKSTFMYIINGIEIATEGSVYFHEKELFKMSSNERDNIRCRNMGFVFQFFNLVQNLTVEENVMLPAVMCNKSVTELRPKLDSILSVIGLVDKKKRFPSQLSGGQQQRVSLARAIINDPEIILADEPTGNLDSKSGTEVMEFLTRINQEYGTTIVQVTHDERKAQYGNRIIQIVDGLIISDSIA